MIRRAPHSALALQRAIYADKFYPRLRVTLRSVFDSHVREYSDSTAATVSPATKKRWAAEIQTALRRQIFAMVAHGWELAGVEVGAPQGKSMLRGFEGKARIGGTEVGDAPKDFLTRADFDSINRWMKSSSLSASETTSLRLENIFKRAAATVTGDTDHPVGVTPRDIAKQILEAGIAQTEARAQMLAHTGAIWSYNEGAVQRYADAGVAVVEWLTADDDLRCPFCAEMNGKRIETKEPFFQAGDTFSFEDKVMKIPGGARGFDVRHPPLHPNCRCTLLPVFEEDLG